MSNRCCIFAAATIYAKPRCWRPPFCRACGASSQRHRPFRAAEGLSFFTRRAAACLISPRFTVATPYRSEFDNFFANLAISRVNYKALATFSLRKAQGAGLPATFTPTLSSLGTHIDAFDENLIERLDPTAGTTLAFQEARKKWLTFVDDTMKDLVTPKLRKLPAFADFKKLSKSRLRNLAQDDLLVESKALLVLYTDNATALGVPTLVANAQEVYDALVAADETRDEQTSTRDDATLALAGDRDDIAADLFALKCQLHLRFPNDPDKVYSFFDFSKVRPSGSKKKTTPPQA